VKSGLEIIPVSRMDEVLAHSLVRKPEPIEWEETEVKGPPEEAAPTPTAEEEQPGLTAH
jgi:ATP-dependent Lon protease